MIIFDDGDGVRRQYKQRLRDLEHERMARQLYGLHQRPSAIARWRAWLGTVLTRLWAHAPRRRAVAGD